MDIRMSACCQLTQEEGGIADSLLQERLSLFQDERVQESLAQVRIGVLSPPSQSLPVYAHHCPCSFHTVLACEDCATPWG